MSTNGCGMEGTGTVHGVCQSGCIFGVALIGWVYFCMALIGWVYFLWLLLGGCSISLVGVFMYAGESVLCPF